MTFADDNELGDALGEEWLTDSRGRPVPPERIYLGEASPYRPIATGDIFRVLNFNGTGPSLKAEFFMITSHPSGMRSGAALENFVRVAPVVVDERLSKKKANVKVIDLFPLPRLQDFYQGDDSLGDGPWGVRVDHAAPLESAALKLPDRHVCLSGYGISLLCQCLAFSDTRVLIREDTIESKLAPKLTEIEWLENWNEDLIRPRLEAGADLEAELKKEADEFEGVMTADRGEGRTLQSMITDLKTLPPVEAEHIMSAELRSRREAQNA